MKLRKLPAIGWREWVALPELQVTRLKCKIDTGAKTSALHTFYLEEFIEQGIKKVRFGLHPDQKNTSTEIHCIATVSDERNVTDSGGHVEKRYVITTPVVLGDKIWPIEITLTNRESMAYRMLLGRSAMSENFIVDPGVSYLMGSPDLTPGPLPYVAHPHDEEEE